MPCVDINIPLILWILATPFIAAGILYSIAWFGDWCVRHGFDE